MMKNAYKTILTCLVLAVFLSGCGSKEATPGDTQTITGPDGKTYVIPKDAIVEFEWVERDTTTMHGTGGSYDSLRDTGGNFKPGGPEKFDLSKGTWSQTATSFVLEVGKTGFGSIALLGAAAVLGGVAAFIFTKDKRYLWLSAAGAGLIVLGYFLQEYGWVLLIVALVAGVIGFLFYTKAGKSLRDQLTANRAALGAVAAAIETDPVTSPKGSPLKQKIQAEVLDSDVSTDAIEDAIDEAKP